MPHFEGPRRIRNLIRISTVRGSARVADNRHTHRPTRALPRTVLMREAREFTTSLNVTDPGAHQ